MSRLDIISLLVIFLQPGKLIINGGAVSPRGLLFLYPMVYSGVISAMISF